MTNKNDKNKRSNLRPNMARPVERKATGSIFNAQPNGGVEAAVPLVFPLPFADDSAE